LKFSDQFPRGGPIVVSLPVNPSHFARAAVEPVAAIGAVEKYFKDWTIVGQQFPQLIAVVSEVFGLAVVLIVAIPWRQVDAKLQAMTTTGLRNLSHHIAPSILPGTLLDSVLGIL
jgi:hypothetical protein